MRALLVAAATLLSVTAATADCRFVDIDDPKFSITMEAGSTPILDYDGTVERYSSTGTGTGQMVLVAESQDSDPAKSRSFAVHEFDGHTFLTWGADLLVERCQ